MKPLQAIIIFAGLCVPAYGYKAFSYSGGVMTDLGSLSGCTAAPGSALAQSVNASGVVTGWACDPMGWIYTAGAMTNVGHIGMPTMVFPKAINAAGSVAGYAGTGTATHGFFYNGTTMTDLGTLGSGNNSYAFGLSDSGIAAGCSGGQTEPEGVAVYWDSSHVIHAIPALSGTTYSCATAISPTTNLIVGFAFATGGPLRAWTYSGTTLTEILNSFTPTAIADNGVIVGVTGVGAVYAVGQAAWFDGTLHVIGALPNDDVSVAMAISGDKIVGSSTKNAVATHAFSYGVSSGTLTNLGALPSKTNAVATGVNASGTICGFSW